MKIESGIRRKKYVVDASVVIKWYSEEKDSIKAEGMLFDLKKGIIQVFAPSLLIYEVGNALYKGKKFEEERVLLAMETLFDSGIEFFPIDEALAISTAHFMVRHNITFYDAAYVALASVLNIPLISADEKGHKKIKEITAIALENM